MRPRAGRISVRHFPRRRRRRLRLSEIVFQLSDSGRERFFAQMPVYQYEFDDPRAPNVSFQIWPFRSARFTARRFSMYSEALPRMRPSPRRSETLEHDGLLDKIYRFG